MQKLKKQNNTLCISKSTNPWFNLSIEEYLLNNINEYEMIFYLWQNKDTVVIGRNQNPWKECNIDKINKDEIKIARRLSGGGAVYHDLGNLNFTFVMGRKLYDLEKQLSVILNAVNLFGLNAEFSGRNDILIDGKKFSGNAYYFDDNLSYHHGTILVNSDMVKLSEYLNPSKQKIISKGIASVKSRVVNLQSINNTITIESVKANLIKSFEDQYGNFSKYIDYDEEIIQEDSFKKLYNTYSSWEWIYGESPSFDICYENRFDWGEIQIGLNLWDGYIRNTKIYSDALCTSFVSQIIDSLNGVRFSTKDIKNAIYSLKDSTDEQNKIYEDILSMF